MATREMLCLWRWINFNSRNFLVLSSQAFQHGSGSKHEFLLQSLIIITATKILQKHPFSQGNHKV